MKRILCLICILAMLLTINGCSSSKTYDIHYDDIMLYVTPTTSAHPGDVVQVIVSAREGASFIISMDTLILSQQDINDKLIIYEFVMPSHDVHITHTKEGEPSMNPITIPASMTRYRISYNTDFAFSGNHAIVTNPTEADALFAGFVLSHEDEIKPYPENFFDNNILIACIQNEGSGSVGHSLKSVILNDSTLTITINREMPYIGTCDIASWLCLISINTSLLPPEFTTHVLTIKQEV